MAFRRVGIWLIVLSSLGAACSDGEESATTDSGAPTVAPPATGIAPDTVGAPAGTTPVGTEAAPTTTLAEELGLPEYRIMSRSEDDVLVVLIEPGTYSDIDLQNVVGDAVERFAPVTGLYLVDDEAAVPLVLQEDLTETEAAILEEHYLLRLEEGFRMIFLGPFEDVGEVILGS